MRKSSISATFQADVQTVWNIVTDNNNYAWRSDLTKIEILEGGNRFIEYTKDGFSMNFTITAKEDLKRYEFDMENKNMTGHWVGIFNNTEDNGTRIDFTEELYIRDPVMELLSHIFMNLKKIQQVYVTDLKKALKEM